MHGLLLRTGGRAIIFAHSCTLLDHPRQPGQQQTTGQSVATQAMTRIQVARRRLPAEAQGFQGSTGKWVSNALLISITFSLVKPPVASSEIALR